MIRRILSSTLALLALAAPALAQTPTLRSISRPVTAPARATESSTLSTQFGYCSAMQNALTTGYANGGVAMQVNAAIARKYAGAKVTAVLVANGSTDSSTETQLPLNVFCSTTLGGTLLATSSGTMDLKKFGEYVEYKLNTPVDIEIGKTFYVGFTYSGASKQAYPIAIDGQPSSWPGLYIGIPDDNGQIQWQNGAQTYGMAGILLHIEGDNLPQNQATLSAYALGRSTLEAGVPVTVTIAAYNEAANPINTVGVAYQFNDEDRQTATATFNEAITPGASGLTSFTITPTTVGANQMLSLKIVEVNGQPYDNENDYAKTAYVTVLEEGSGFSRNVVVEERTGTWCGWCPRGIVGIEKMKKEFNDGTFIPIAVHVLAQDPMISAGYSAIDQMISSAPAAMVNRDFLSIGDIDPNYDELKAAYQIARNIPAAAEITINSVEEGTRVTKFDITTRFALSETNARYRIALVAVEDQVGPYPQTNYYSGSGLTLDGWETKPNPANTTFNDVARIIKSYQGITSSVPSTIEAGTDYSYTKGALENTKITKLENVRYVALLINSMTGRIENAASIASPSATGIEDIASPDNENAPVRYYNLQGQTVENPTHGQLLIRACGTKRSKVIF